MRDDATFTLLYVPADREDRARKALASDADVVILDLEDAVAPATKDRARARVQDLVAAAVGRPLQIRINGAGTPWHADDVELVRALPAHVGVRVPKCESPRDVRRLGERVGEHALHLLVESARGVEMAYEMACADARVGSLGLGEADLRADLGVTSDEALAWARGRVVNATAAAQLPPPAMSVYPDIHDADGLAASCAAGKALGFFGRAAIHPAQLPVIRAAFRPTNAEVAHARAVLAAWDMAAAQDAGVVALPSGVFVDAAVVRQARRVLAASA